MISSEIETSRQPIAHSGIARQQLDSANH